jgi:hypothetical protein
MHFAALNEKWNAFDALMGFRIAIDCDRINCEEHAEDLNGILHVLKDKHMLFQNFFRIHGFPLQLLLSAIKSFLSSENEPGLSTVLRYQQQPLKHMNPNYFTSLLDLIVKNGTAEQVRLALTLPHLSKSEIQKHWKDTINSRDPKDTEKFLAIQNHMETTGIDLDAKMIMDGLSSAMRNNRQEIISVLSRWDRTPLRIIRQLVNKSENSLIRRLLLEEYQNRKKRRNSVEDIMSHLECEERKDEIGHIKLRRVPSCDF